MEKNHIPVLPIVQITAQLSLVTLPDALYNNFRPDAFV